MSDPSSERDPVEELAEEFLERQRRGERPDVAEYARRYPEWADRIRKVFRALALMEDVRPAAEATGSVAGPPAGAAGPGLERLGDYRILREVGRGGMGIVYEAEQISLGRHVALKILPQRLPEDRAKQRFEREAKAAARLHHTNIVPVFGVGEHDGLPYYVMQFIPGLGLDEVLLELKRLQPGQKGSGGAPHVFRKEVSAADVARSLVTGQFAPAAAPAATVDHAPDGMADQDPRAVPPGAGRLSGISSLSGSSAVLPGAGPGQRPATYWQSVARIGVQVADALEHAHRQGIHHRDVKPSNLLLDRQGTVWVTDFGLAKADDQQNLTHTGDVLGTLRYLPPEAFEGRTDARGDVYSLGLTLYELLALRPAFDESDRHKLIKQVTTGVPSRLDKLNREVPRDLVTIVHKAIDREPARRYATAAALAEDLQRFLADEPIRARRVSRTERLRRWGRRNPAVASLAAALALVLLAGFAGVTWKWREAERQKDNAQASELSEAAQRAIAVEQAERSRRLLYASDSNLAQQAWEAGDTGRARSLLARQWPQAGQEDLRGFEWRYLWPLCQDASRHTLRGHTDQITEVAFAPDGKTLVTSSSDHSVRLWDVASRRHVKLLMYRVTSVAFAPDGKTLAVTGQFSRSVRFWDVAARCERATLPHPADVLGVAFSPDGKLLATGCGDRIVRLWDVATRREVGTFRGHTASVLRVAFSHDGRTLASGGTDTTVRLWDVPARRAIATLQGHTDWVTSLFFSPDGKTLASASNDHTVRLWDTATRQGVKTLRGQRTVLNSVAFSPDGKTLATGGGDSTVRIWDAATNEVAALLRGHTAPITAVAFAPDGRSLVSGSRDGTVKVWDVAARPDPNTLIGHKANLKSLAFSPDGKTLAVSDNDGMVRLWDMASRQQVAVLKGHHGPVWCVTFAPGGQTLASAGGDKTIHLWDVAKKERVAEFQHSEGALSAAFSPDGKLLAAAGWGTDIRVWDLATRREVALLTPGNKVQFTPDGAMLAASWNNTVRLWDVATWRNVAALTGHTANVGCFAIARDGRALATGDADGTLRLWDVVQKRPVASRTGHTSNIASVAFSPDGRRVATGGGDGTVKLWDVAPLQEVATLTGHDGSVNSVAFSPDGNTLATASADAIRLWQAPPLTEALREPAEAPSVPPPVETIRLFALVLYGTPQATLGTDGNAVRVDVTAVDGPGGNVIAAEGPGWKARVLQMFDDLQEGATYTIRFRAKADAPRRLALQGQIDDPDWHLTGLNELVPLTEDWQDYQYQFQAKALAGWSRIQFLLGDRTGTVWITDFTLTKGAK